MSKRWQPHAQHIKDAIDKVNRIVERGDIREDDILYDAALRNIQTLSESTQHLPNFLKDKHRSVPWKEISGFRNILVHNYLGNIDPETVLNVIEVDLENLELAVTRMLDECI